MNFKTIICSSVKMKKSHNIPLSVEFDKHLEIFLNLNNFLPLSFLENPLAFLQSSGTNLCKWILRKKEGKCTYSLDNQEPADSSNISKKC